MITPHHAKYYANELLRSGGTGIDRLSRSLFDACVDLNPHQIEAALFAIKSPISKGVLLADEVGLGKTIEAGLVLCEYWAERKRKLIIISPASLRKQWAIELKEKFNLESVVIDAKSYKEIKAKTGYNPFDNNLIVITSIHYASRHCEEIKTVPWDLVVVDESHKLRNAYRSSNKMGQNIKYAIQDYKKILLTATPLQNSLLELYGLSTIIDPRIFGDLPSFRTQFMNVGGDLQGLRERIKPFYIRTLRQQVLEYIKYTERRLITRPFKPTDQEHKLYKAISKYLQRDDTYAFPPKHKHLTTLIIRKLLASSSQALAGTLETIRNRLVKIKEEKADVNESDLLNILLDDEEIDDEFIEDIFELNDEELLEKEEEHEEKIDLEKVKQEILELDRYITWARSIGIDTKSKALLTALEIGFSKMEEIGADRKALIFTESRRTQEFLKGFLESNGYYGKVATFNGSNRDTDSKKVFENWFEKNEEAGRTHGSKSVNIRTAIIEYFRDTADILIATEAAAEGINLQFCSLVINYDLPWNPQRIEQRVGRCHSVGLRPTTQ